MLINLLLFFCGHFQIILFPEDESKQEFDKVAHNSAVLFLSSCSDIFSPEAYEDKYLA